MTDQNPYAPPSAEIIAPLGDRPFQTVGAGVRLANFFIDYFAQMGIGFAFGFIVAATAGILSLTPGLEARLGWLPRMLRQGLAASLAAQLATLPLLWPLEGGVHPMALLLNLVALPWLAVFLVCNSDRHLAGD